MYREGSGYVVSRRTESVAEKLLADWLAFNLYEHLQGPPSVAMYRMFLGIKGHLESGPVDVLNGSAGHSLSEEKLMRQEVEHMVSIPEHYHSNMHECNVFIENRSRDGGHRRDAVPLQAAGLRHDNSDENKGDGCPVQGNGVLSETQARGEKWN